jgi:hypothetical protein
MTLQVSSYFYDSDGKHHWLDDPLPEPRTDSAGAEVWRTAVWGSKEVRALGLRILPSLAAGNINAEGADLDVLEQELNVLREHIPKLYKDATTREQVLYRIENIAYAITRARANNGGVYIG